MLLLLACKGAEVPADDSALDSRADSALDSAPADDTDSPVDTDTGEEAPVDADSDGAMSDVDCDDHNDKAFPGNEEVFDGYDNDCDGRVDAEGGFSGTVSGSAQGWLEGKSYTFSLSCPTTLERDLVDFDFEVLCTTDPGDEMAQKLLGATISMVPVDPYLWELEAWADTVEFTSSNGWDTLGDGKVTWTDMDTAKVEVSLDSLYLDMSLKGKVLAE